ncbi:MAG TPA: hypothetical protein VFY65_21220 [Longimicrobium sp.]|nr:hypothetical protein [Longimicrobium sp.]
MHGTPRRILYASGWALVMAVAACARFAPGDLLPAVDDAAVYRAVLTAERARGLIRPLVQRTSEPVVAFPGEGVAQRLAMYAATRPALDATTVRSFLALNGQVAAIPDLGDTTVSWVSREEWRAWGYGWDEYLALDRDSAGVIVFSRVGYSRDGTQALVYVTRPCPPCGGWSDYVLLARTGGVWTVTARWNVWLT